MKKRLISAFVALLIVIPLLIMGGYPFIFGCCILAILAYKEIIDLKKSHQEIPNIVIALGLISLISLVLNNLKDFSVHFGISYQRILLIMLFLIIPTIFYKNDKYTTKDAFYLIGNTFFIGLFFNLLIILRYRDFYLLIYLIIIPILTDTFAFIGGKLLGKHKLAPKISPNKTWEGAFIGLIVGSSLSYLYYGLVVCSFTLKGFFLTILLSLVGQMGDLIMSKIKRENEIKDFSNIMPGHGGILDRLDSLMLVIITYVILIYL